MAWIRNSLLATCCLASLPAFAAELLWRVDNEAKSEIMPLYEDQITPFPVQDAPRIAITPQQNVSPRISEEMLKRRKRAMEAANLLSRVREILKDDKAFTPNVTSLKVEAVMESETGVMVLLNNEWRKKGEIIEVPVASAQEMLTLISQIGSVDENLSSAVQEEVDERMTSLGRMQLEISELKENAVIFKNQQGKDVVINFVRSHW